MAKKNQVTVSKLPVCDLCKIYGQEREADYDAKIPGEGWANLCHPHFIEAGCRLGTGRGQRLIVEHSA